MDTLIAELEAAARGSRELDHRIAELCVPPTEDARMAALESGDDWPRSYTTSIDAALTLVPEGRMWVHLWSCRNGDDGPDYHHCEIEVPEADDWMAKVRNAPNPALALCIAALKARATNPTAPAQSQKT